MMFKLWILGFIKINCPISQWTYTNDFFIISQWTYTNDFFIISQWTYTNDFFIISQWTYTNDFFIISTNNSYTSSFCYKMFFTDNRTLKWKKYIPTRYFCQTNSCISQHMKMLYRWWIFTQYLSMVCERCTQQYRQFTSDGQPTFFLI